jgi:hypothetical protein
VKPSSRVVGQHHLGSDGEQLGVVVVKAFVDKLICVACTYVCVVVADFEHGREGRGAFVVEAFADVICSE